MFSLRHTYPVAVAVALFVGACAKNNSGDEPRERRGCGCGGDETEIQRSASAVELEEDEVLEIFEIDTCEDLFLWGEIELAPTGVAGVACDSVVSEGAVALYLEGDELLVDVYVTEEQKTCERTVPIGAFTIHTINFFLEEEDRVWSAGYNDAGDMLFEATLEVNNEGLWEARADIWDENFEGKFSGVEEGGWIVPRGECS